MYRKVDQDAQNHKQSEDLMDIVPNQYRQPNVYSELPIAICGNGEHVSRRNFTHLQLFLLYGVSNNGTRSEQKQVLDTFRRLLPRTKTSSRYIPAFVAANKNKFSIHSGVCCREQKQVLDTFRRLLPRTKTSSRYIPAFVAANKNKFSIHSGVCCREQKQVLDTFRRLLPRTKTSSRYIPAFVAANKNKFSIHSGVCCREQKQVLDTFRRLLPRTKTSSRYIPAFVAANKNKFSIHSGVCCREQKQVLDTFRRLLPRTKTSSRYIPAFVAANKNKFPIHSGVCCRLVLVMCCLICGCSTTGKNTLGKFQYRGNRSWGYAIYVVRGYRFSVEDTYNFYQSMPYIHEYLFCFSIYQYNFAIGW